MILDFLTAGLKAWVANGHPLLLEATFNDYLLSARTFEEMTGCREEVFEAERDAIASLDKADTILFVRPKMESNVTSALTKFQVVQVEDRPSTSPARSEGRLRLATLRWNWLVWNCISSEGDESAKWTQLFLFEIRNLLEAVRPKLICFSMDLLPLERAIGLVARTLSIPTVTIQDGVFSSQMAPHLLFGEASEHFIVWSEYTKRLLLRAGRFPAERIHVAGYPYPIKELPPAKESPQKTVVFLGQNFEYFGDDLSEAKRRIAKTVRRVCERLGIRFLYRPHPGERPDTLTDIIPSGSLLPKTQPLVDLFAEHDCFVGITSTAILEAALHGRTAIQVYDPIFNFENLAEVGACHACGASEEEISAILERLARGELGPLPVNPDYLPICPDIDARLLEIYSDIAVGSAARLVPARQGNAYCIAGVAKPAAEMIPAGFSLLNGASQPGQKPIDGMAALSNSSGFPAVIPFHLDVQEVYREFCAWSSGNAEPITIAGEAACHAQNHLSATQNVVGRTIVIEPPKTDNEIEALQWLMLVSGAFQGGSEPTAALFPEASPSTGDSWAERTYEGLRRALDGLEGPIHTSVLTACGSLAQLSLEAALADLKTTLMEDARGRKLAELKASLAALQDEFDRVRATKFWKIREGLVKLRQKLR